MASHAFKTLLLQLTGFSKDLWYTAVKLQCSSLHDLFWCKQHKDQASHLHGL